jgi:phytoene synthase
MRDAVVAAELPALSELAAPAAYMARHSRSFRFATAFMSAAERGRLERVYAWCRYTDDLADGAGAQADGNAGSRLDAWIALSRRAYAGTPSGIAVVDRAMREMAEASVQFRYAEELVLGMRSDLQFRLFTDSDALRVYTYRVAGVVGQWLTELQGVRDPWVLDRAAALGHAMQITNILRDVGEDLDRGRVYLPLELLKRHGLTIASLDRMRRGGPVSPGYRNLVEEMMDDAARHYRLAREGMSALPPDFRRGVSIASAVYEGIIDEIRRNGYDNLRRRARTTTARKLTLAAGVLVSSFFRGEAAPNGAAAPRVNFVPWSRWMGLSEQAPGVR